jgi:neutral ceramidase
MKTSYLASFIEINITPNSCLGMPLQGFFGLPRLAKGIESPLQMQLLMLEDQNSSRILIITADLFGIDTGSVSRIRQHLESWGIPAEAFFFSASHTHYAPGTLSTMPNQMGLFLDQYTTFIEKSIISKLPELYDKLEPANIYKSSCNVRIGSNRRGLDQDNKRTKILSKIGGSYDEHTPILLLHHTKSNQKTLLIQHGCHPTGLGNASIISPDYPGYVRSILKKSKLVQNVMFFQGGAGDTKQTIPGDHLSFCTNANHIYENAKKISVSVLNCFSKKWTAVHGPLRSAIHQIDLQVKPFETYNVAQKIKNNDHWSKLTLAWLEHISKIDKSYLSLRSIPLDIQILGIGSDWHLLALPAEPVSGLVMRLRQLFPNPSDVMIAGYTNGLVGYLPTEDILKEGGYEAEASHLVYGLPGPFERGIETSIMEKTKKIIENLDNPKTPRSIFPRILKKYGEAFFVMSTGRCGTMTLAHGLSMAQNATVWHHPNPLLVLETQLAYWGKIDTKSLFWRARGNQIREAWSQNQIYGETDHNMTPFCDMIAKEIPNSKFIILVRHPYDFVRSGMRRNYYNDDDNIWDRGRYLPEKESEEYIIFEKLKQLEKVAWLWNATYHKINGITKDIQNNRVFLVRFEDLVNGPDIFRVVYKFLGLKKYNEDSIDNILTKKLNSQKKGYYPKPSSWDDVEKISIWNKCSYLAEKFGYKFEHII